MSLPCGLLDTLLFLRVLCRLLLDVLLPSNLLWLLLLVLVRLLGLLLWLLLLLLVLLVLLLGLLRLSLLVLVRLLGLLLWLLLLLLILRLGMLLRLCLSMLLLLLRLGMLLWLCCLSMLLRLRLRMFLLLLLLGLGLLLFVLCECRNKGSERQKQNCCSETCKCFHWYCLNYKTRRTGNEWLYPFDHREKLPNKKGPSALDPSLTFGLLRELPSLHNPADRYPSRNAYCERHYNCLNRVSLQALGGVIKELFSSVAALFCDTPCCSHAIFKCIRNGRCRQRSLARRFGNLLAGSFQH